MFCNACGKELDEGSAFCRHCGANQVHPSAGASPPVVAAGAQLAEAAKAQFLGWAIGDRVTFVGALVAAISFFLPWAGVMGEQVGGLGLVKVWGGVLLILAFAVASVVLVSRTGGLPASRRFVITGVQIAIGALFGPQLLISLLLIPMAQQVLAAGAWGLALGFTAVLVGGFMSLAELVFAAVWPA